MQVNSLFERCNAATEELVIASALADIHHIARSNNIPITL